jgi:hypothetical protein
MKRGSVSRWDDSGETTMEDARHEGGGKQTEKVEVGPKGDLSMREYFFLFIFFFL